MAATGCDGFMKEAVVRARVELALKEDAERIFEALGINTTEALRHALDL